MAPKCTANGKWLAYDGGTATAVSAHNLIETIENQSTQSWYLASANRMACVRLLLVGVRCSAVKVCRRARNGRKLWTKKFSLCNTCGTLLFHTCTPHGWLVVPNQQQQRNWWDFDSQRQNSASTLLCSYLFSDCVCFHDFNCSLLFSFYF